MTLIHELSEPYPMTETSRGELLDRIYEVVSDSRPDRREHVEWAIRAGGEVR